LRNALAGEQKDGGRLRPGELPAVPDYVSINFYMVVSPRS